MKRFATRSLFQKMPKRSKRSRIILPTVSDIEGEIDLWTKEIEKNFRVIRAESYEEILKQVNG